MGMAQVLGMTRYEFLMHWRRRTLQVATFSLLGLNLIILFVLGQSMEQYLAQFGTLDPSVPPNIVPFFWIPIYFTILVLYGPMMAEVIPLDSNLNMRELLDSLPLKRESYLAGKLLGMFLALLSGLIIGAVVLGIAAWFVFGGFDIPPFIQMWLVGVIPIALLSPGLTLLLAAGQSTRRRAASIGGGFAVLCIALFVSSTKALLAGAGDSVLLDSFNPARPAILRYFMPASSNGATVSMLSSSAGNEVVLAVVVGVAELFLVAAAIWWWLRWRESRV